MASEEKVLAALRNVKYPGLSKDIVAFGFVRDIAVDGDRVEVTLRFQSDNPAVGEELARKSDVALRDAGFAQVAVKLDTVPRAQMPTGVGGAMHAIKALSGVRSKIAVASGKGGVGKSTVSTNLALALRGMGHDVALLDADIYGPSQQMMLGIEGRPLIDPDNQKIIPMEGHGIRTMSLGLITDPDTPVIWRGPMVMKALDQFLSDVQWGDVDYMVLDLPPGTGDAQLTLTQKVPLTGAIIVTTPQDVALIDARKGLAMFQKVGVPVLGIVENMSYYLCRHCGEREEIFGHGGGRRTAEMLGVPFLGEIPIDPRVVVGGDSGRPIVISDPESPAASAFRDIAERTKARIEEIENEPTATLR